MRLVLKLLWHPAAEPRGSERALRAATTDAAKILGIADRVGALEAGKDADGVVLDRDPFEYTSHVEAVLVNGQVTYRRGRWKKTKASALFYRPATLGVFVNFFPVG